MEPNVAKNDGDNNDRSELHVVVGVVVVVVVVVVVIIGLVRCDG